MRALTPPQPCLPHHPSPPRRPLATPLRLHTFRTRQRSSELGGSPERLHCYSRADSSALSHPARRSVRSVIARFRPVNERERAEMAEQENPVNFLNEQTVGALPQPAAQPRLVALAAWQERQRGSGCSL